MSNAIQGPKSVGAHHFLYVSLRVFLSFIGIVDVASMAYRHGYKWHEIVISLVKAYRENFYPFYHMVFGPTLNWLHFTLTPDIEDIFTVMSLAFACARLESRLRDKRSLFRNITMAYAAAMNNDDDNGRTKAARSYSGMFKSFATMRSSALFAIGFALALPFVFPYLPWVYRQLFHFAQFVFFGHFVAVVGTLSGFLFVAMSIPLVILWLIEIDVVPWLEESFGESPEEPYGPNSVIALALAIPFFPFLLLLILPVMILPAALSIVTAFVAMILISPLMAWRTTILTTMLFATLMGLNWAALHHA